MAVLHLTKDELMLMFMKTTLDYLFSATLAEVIEKHIEITPDGQQECLLNEVGRLRKTPHLLFAGLKGNGTYPVDYESESFRNFEVACDRLIDYFEKNYCEVEDTFQQSYLEMGVTLIVD